MAEKKENNSLYWILFLVSAIVCIFLLIAYPAYFWIPLPFVLTCFTKAMNWI